MRSLFISGALASLSAHDEAVFAGQSAGSIMEKFEEFIVKFGKKYPAGEKAIRLAHFIENCIKLGRHAAADPHAAYSHLTPFMDWSEEEFKARNTLRASDMLSVPAKRLSTTAVDLTNIPATLDWRDHGAVQQVKDQARCGSCWAFSSVSNIESAAVVQGGQPLRSLSEEQLVECSQSDSGCNGGLQARAYYDMIEGSWGLELESEYPYTSGGGQVGSCKMQENREVQYIDNMAWASPNPGQGGNSDEAIMAALAKYGPLAIALDATPMQFYRGQGTIARTPKCSHNIDHAVNLVGYNTKDGVDYWIVRNSWGTVWGNEGYWYVERGNDNCAINDFAITAVVNKKELRSAEGDECMEKHTEQGVCNADAKCTWCQSAAVASACHTLENSRLLPPSVFWCDAKSIVV